MIEQFVPTGFIRYVPELVFAQTAFACAVLLKVRIFALPFSLFSNYIPIARFLLFQCLRPEFRDMLDRSQEERIVQLIKRLHDTWTSNDIATNENHTSKLYARLIKQLVDPHLIRLQQPITQEYTATELNSPSDVSTSPTSSIPEVSPYTQSVFPPLPTEVNVKPIIQGMEPEFNVSWEGIYSDPHIMQPGPLPTSPSDTAFVMSDAEYMSAVMALANETWLI